MHTIELCACMFFHELQSWVIFEAVYLCMLPQSALIAFSAVGRVATFNRYNMKQCKWSSVVMLRKSSSVEVYQAFLDSFGVFMKKCIMWGSLSIHVDCCLQFDAFRYSDADWSSSIICSRKQAIYRMSYWERKVPISPSYKMWAVFSEDKAVKVFDSPFAFCRTIFDVSKVREFVTTQYHQSTASHSEGSSQERTYARTLTGFPYKKYSFWIFGLPDSTVFGHLLTMRSVINPRRTHILFMKRNGLRKWVLATQSSSTRLTP